MASHAESGGLDSRAAWIATSAALAVMTIAYGAPLIAVLAMKPIAADLDTARSGPAAAGSFTYLGAAFGGIVAGWLVGRLGIRRIVLFGGVMVAAGLVLSASGGLLFLYAGHGVLMSLFGTSCMFSPCSPMSAVGSSGGAARRWRSSSGQSIAGAIWPPCCKSASTKPAGATR